MPHRGFVSDWNGTLFRPATDEGLNRTIAYQVLLHALNPFSNKQFGQLTEAKRLLEKELARYTAGEIPLEEVYRPFNELVVNGTPARVINRAADRYAKKHAGDVDGKMLRPIQDAQKRGMRTGVLSVSYDRAIRAALKDSGFDEAVLRIVANNLMKHEEGIARGFSNQVYGKKAELIREKFMDQWGYREQDMLYAGNDLADDGPVAELLPHGHFIVPFFADEDVKQAFAEKYRAFVPSNEQDLDRYLRADS